MTFKSGKPRPPNSGRKKGSTNVTATAVRALAAMPEVVAWWRNLVQDAEVPLEFRIKASEHIANRALGRPSESVAVTTDQQVTVYFGFEVGEIPKTPGGPLINEVPGTPAQIDENSQEYWEAKAREHRERARNAGGAVGRVQEAGKKMAGLSPHNHVSKKRAEQSR